MASPVLDGEQLARLRDRFREYSQGSHYRANALAIRSRAHALIRDLTAPDNLASLSLDDFDRIIWHGGTLRTRLENLNLHQGERVLAQTSPDRFLASLDSGELSFVGNMTWGSAAKTLRAYAHGRSREELEAKMRHAIGLLLYEKGPIEDRLRNVGNLRIGFGRNVSSGLLMVWHPQDFILYNSRSEGCWTAFSQDFDVGYNWVRPYLRYNGFCGALLSDPMLNLQNLVDLDIFVYWHTIHYPPSPKVTTPTRKKRGRKPKNAQPDIALEQLKATRREMPPDKFRATWGGLYDKLVAEELSKRTTDVTAAELGQRAKRRVDEIHAFLHGQTATTPTAEVLCDWIRFCYDMELYREAAALLPYVHEDEVEAAIYRRSKRIAEVSRRKLIG